MERSGDRPSYKLVDVGNYKGHKMVTRRRVEDARGLTCPFIQHASLVMSTITPGKSDLLAFEDPHSPANIDCVAKSCMSWVDLNDGAGYCKLIENK